MSTRHHAGRALHTALALALLTALPILNGCATEDPLSEPDALAAEAIGEVAEACGSGPYNPGPYYPVPNPGPYYPGNQGPYYPGNQGPYYPGNAGPYYPGNPGPFPPAPAFTPGVFACESSAGPSTLVVRNDGVCLKVPQPTAAASETYCVAGACPPCWKLAREVIGCALQ